MTRQEIETYLLHAKVEPASFVLDEQADRLEAAIRREVLQAKIDILEVAFHRGVWSAIKGQVATLRAELAALDKGDNNG